MKCGSYVRRGCGCACAAVVLAHSALGGQPATYQGCGVLEELVDCGLGFIGQDGKRFVPANLAGFGAGDAVFVSGVIDPSCAGPLSCPYPCLVDNAIGACFDECGTLVSGVECVLFLVGAGPNAGTYVVSNLGGFNVGDTVRVTGIHDPGCVTFCQQGNGCVNDNTIAKCTIFEGCGTLHIGPQSCTIFAPDDGGPGYVLAEYGKFSLGDHVFVSGAIDFASPACFPVTIPLIENDSITACGTPFQACGIIVAPPFCGLALAADAGGVWLLDQLGPFNVGDRVFVDGTIVDPCFTVPECSVDGCVDVGTIRACGETYFSGCGQIVLSFTCGFSFAAADGSGIYVLADFGKGDVGDHIFVQGPIVPECPQGNGFCDCIDNSGTGVMRCAIVGDLNDDGLVNGADLGLLLGAWGPCPPFRIGCLGDFNFDGEVDGADLGVLLGNWTG
ncbi:MAG: hypothetical protein U0575_02855 [Phycisphaerales bacterium]